MEAQERVEGRARVVELLWGRIDDAGVRSPLKVNEQQFGEMRKRLTRYLAYMRPESLAALAEIVIDCSNGPKADRCPSEVFIRNQAKGLEKPPVEEHEIVTSWLRSVAGPPALSGGYAVALLWWLARRAPPGPSDYDMQGIRDEGKEHQRRCQLIEDRIRRGAASDKDRAWLDRYQNALVRVQGLVADGEANRASKLEGVA